MPRCSLGRLPHYRYWSMSDAVRIPLLSPRGKGRESLRLRVSPVVIRPPLSVYLNVWYLIRGYLLSPQCGRFFVMMCSVVWRLLCRSMTHGYLLQFFLLLLNLLQVHVLFIYRHSCMYKFLFFSLSKSYPPSKRRPTAFFRRDTASRYSLLFHSIMSFQGHNGLSKNSRTIYTTTYIPCVHRKLDTMRDVLFFFSSVTSYPN